MDHADSQDKGRNDEIQRAQRSARLLGTLGPLLFYIGIAVAVFGGWLVFGPGIEGIGETTGIAIFILAVILLLDGVLFTVMSRRARKTARSLEEQS